MPSCAALLAIVTLFLTLPALGGDYRQHAENNPARAEWFKKQMINPAAKERMQIPYDSCCDAGDSFKTRFRVGAQGQDSWEYLDSDGKWKAVPPDIINNGASPDGEPILFKRPGTGEPVCFYPGQGGL